MKFYVSMTKNTCVIKNEAGEPVFANTNPTIKNELDLIKETLEKFEELQGVKSGR